VPTGIISAAANAASSSNNEAILSDFPSIILLSV
jgi:hypothetical protein